MLRGGTSSPRVAISRDVGIDEITHLQPSATKPVVEFEGSE